MNFDPLYYATLNPIVLKLHVFAGTLLAASVLWHWTRGAYSGLLGKTREGLSKWWSAGVALLFFLLVYAPIPNPHQLIGFDQPDFDISQTGYERTTVAIFLSAFPTAWTLCLSACLAGTPQCRR